MILMIKIILIIAVVIIINSPFEPGDFSTGSTTDLLNSLYTSDLHLDHKHFKVVLFILKTGYSLPFLFFPDRSTLQKNKTPYLRRHGKEAFTKRHLVKKMFWTCCQNSEQTPARQSWLIFLVNLQKFQELFFFLHNTSGRQLLETLHLATAKTLTQLQLKDLNILYFAINPWKYFLVDWQLLSN